MRSLAGAFAFNQKTPAVGCSQQDLAAVDFADLMTMLPERHIGCPPSTSGRWGLSFHLIHKAKRLIEELLFE